MRTERMLMTWGSSSRGSSITSSTIIIITTTTITNMEACVARGRSRGMPKPPDWVVNELQKEMRVLVWNSRLWLNWVVQTCCIYWAVLPHLDVNFALLSWFRLLDAWMNNSIVAFWGLWCFFVMGIYFIFTWGLAVSRVVNCRHYRLVSCYVERHRSSAGTPFVLHHGASIAVAVVDTTVYSFAGKKVCWLFYWFHHSSCYYFIFYVTVAACFELAIHAMLLLLVNH